jgi:hypothetical protein
MAAEQRLRLRIASELDEIAGASPMTTFIVIPRHLASSPRKSQAVFRSANAVAPSSAIRCEDWMRPHALPLTPIEDARRSPCQ